MSQWTPSDTATLRALVEMMGWPGEAVTGDAALVRAMRDGVPRLLARVEQQEYRAMEAENRVRLLMDERDTLRARVEELERDEEGNEQEYRSSRLQEQLLGERCSEYQTTIWNVEKERDTLRARVEELEGVVRAVASDTAEAIAVERDTAIARAEAAEAKVERVRELAYAPVNPDAIGPLFVIGVSHMQEAVRAALEGK